MSEIDSKLKKIFLDIFNINSKDFSSNSSMKNIEKWDSLNHIGLISEIENQFSINFKDEEVIEMINFKVIKNKIHNYKKNNI